MQTITVTVGPDGRVEIPGTRAGQSVTIHVERDSSKTPVAVQRSPEEVERIIQEIREGAKRVREQADPQWLSLDHGEWLYGPDGLPR